MIRWPTNIPADKANHYVRGSQIATVCGAVVTVLSIALAPRYDPGLQGQTLIGMSLIGGGIAGLFSAAFAGWLVERIQQLENDARLAYGADPIHQIERADIRWTARGGIPTAVPLLAAGLVLLLG